MCVNAKVALLHESNFNKYSSITKPALCVRGFSIHGVTCRRNSDGTGREITLKVFRKETHNSRATRFTAGVGEAGTALF